MKEKRPKSKVVCVVATVYAFLLYLLYHRYDEINKTFFVFDPLFPNVIAQRVKNGYHLDKSPSSKWYNMICYYRSVIRKRLPKLGKNVAIFAQDHTLSQIIYLSNNQYTFIEDSPCICKAFYNSSQGMKDIRERCLFKSRIASILLGPLYLRGLADNSQATALLLTKEDESPFLHGKRRLFVPTIDNALWSSFSNEKRKFITDVFSIDEKLMGKSTGDKILLLTDPLAESRCISIEEQQRIYKVIMANYDESHVIIKTHPRDHFFDYHQLFPQSIVIDKPFPSELFRLLGVPFGRIVTAFSSAVNPFIGVVPIDWYGIMNEDLKKEIGDYPAPEGVNVITIDSMCV